jgi:periplasmic copper chaperone A
MVWMVSLVKSVRTIACVVSVLLVVPALAQPLAISDARIRAMPPGSVNSAAYLTVTNVSEGSLTIVGASSPAAGRVELHTTVQEDGMMQMRAVKALSLAPGESVELAPGGLHLMLLQLAERLEPAAAARLCLDVAELDEPLCFDAVVAEMTRQGSAHRH